MEVKAAVARDRASALSIEGLRLDEPRADEALVRLVAAGISQVDLDAIDGTLPIPLPFVPGTGAAGIVERVGHAVGHIAPGDAVVATFASCGCCAGCRSGHPRMCAAFKRLNLSGQRQDGTGPFVETNDVGGFFFGQSAFATHMLCQASSLVKVPATAPLEVLACLSGEVLLGAGTVSRGLHLTQGDSLAVVGADAVGLAAIMMAKALEADPIVVADPDERRRKLAEDCGATVTVHAYEALADVARGLTGAGVRFAIDTTGDIGAEDACRRSVWSGGTCAFKRTTSKPTEHGAERSGDGPKAIAIDEYAAPSALIPKLAALNEKGRLPLDRIINFFAFEHVNDALDALRRRDIVKPVLRFSLGSFGDLDRAQEEGAVTDTDPPDNPNDEDEKQDASEAARVTS